MLGSELSLTSVTRTSRLPGPGPGAPRRWRGDTAAIIALLALPVLVYGVPALLGHPVLPGDDLTQNFPLRVLAGHEIRSGHLPLYNPYIWSGAPLLAGWNAGAAYPFTFLFAVAPPVAAWTLNMILTWAIAGTGMFVFLRACRLGCGPAVLGALSFAFAGAMSAQVAHLGLMAGMRWVPVQLLCVLRLTGPRSMSSRLAWTGTLAGAFGLTILAGEPRAIDDAGVVVGLYAAWQVARLGRRFGPAALSVAAGLALRQRLQSRNILVADLALAVLLAYWADRPAGEDSRRFLRIRGRRGPDLETVLAAAPPLAVLTVAALGLSWGTGLLRWLKAGPAAATLDGALKPWLVPYASRHGPRVSGPFRDLRSGPARRPRSVPARRIRSQRDQRHAVGPGVHLARLRVLRVGHRIAPGHRGRAGRARPPGRAGRGPGPARHLRPPHRARIPGHRVRGSHGRARSSRHRPS